MIRPAYDQTFYRDVPTNRLVQRQDGSFTTVTDYRREPYTVRMRETVMIPKTRTELIFDGNRYIVFFRSGDRLTLLFHGLFYYNEDTIFLDNGTLFTMHLENPEQVFLTEQDRIIASDMHNFLIKE